MESNKKSVILAGVDLAWQSERNPSAIAQGTLLNGTLLVTAVDKFVFGINAILERLRTDLSGIAIDAPLIIKNISGQRPCERDVGIAYGSKGASCHSSSTSLFPDAQSVCLSRKLFEKGFDHLGEKRWQIECYPHPAIIEMFGLPWRLKYKRGLVSEKRAGQQKLASYIRKLEGSASLAFIVSDPYSEFLNEDFIAELKGRDLKANEDALDSLICLYVAGLYAVGSQKRQCFGDKNTGYIWVPVGSCI